MIIEIALGIVLAYIIIRLLPLLGCLAAMALIVAVIGVIGAALYAGGMALLQDQTTVLVLVGMGVLAVVVTVVSDLRADRKSQKLRE